MGPRLPLAALQAPCPLTQRAGPTPRVEPTAPPGGHMANLCGGHRVWVSLHLVSWTLDPQPSEGRVRTRSVSASGPPEGRVAPLTLQEAGLSWG